jgi:hypothetical protein
MTVTIDLNEGRTVEMCCIPCHELVTGEYGPAHHPSRMYLASVECGQCSTPFVTFDAFLEAA